MSNSTDYTIGIGLETEASSTAELEKALKSLQQTIEQLNAAFANNRAADGMKSQAQQASKMQQQAQSATVSVEHMNDVFVENASVTLSSAAANEQLIQSMIELNKAQRAEALAATEVKQQQLAGYDEAAAALKNQYHQLLDVGRSYETLAQYAGEFGDTLVSGARAAFDGFAEVEDALQAVRRTTLDVGESAKAMNDNILGVIDSVALSVKEITSIAEAGGAADVPRAMLESYTRAVGVFADSTETSANEAGLAIAKIYNLTKGQNPDQDYEQIANSIFQVGVSAASTSDQILKMTTRISALGASYNVTAPEAIGLSSTLASLGIEAERGGTSIIRQFSQISKIIGQGGDKLDYMASLAKMSAEEFAQAWEDRPIAALMELARGMKATGQITNEMAKLNMNATRDAQVLMNLAGNYEETWRQIGIAEENMATGGVMFDQYALRVHTVAEQMQILSNNVQTLQYSAMEGLPLAGILEFINERLQNINEAMRNSPFMAAFGAINVVAAALLGNLSRFGSQILQLAANISMVQASQVMLNGAVSQGAVAQRGFAASVKASIAELLGLKTAANGATTTFATMKKVLSTVAVPFFAFEGALLAIGAIGDAIHGMGQATRSVDEIYETSQATVGNYYDAVMKDARDAATSVANYGAATQEALKSQIGEQEIKIDSGFLLGSATRTETLADYMERITEKGYEAADVMRIVNAEVDKAQDTDAAAVRLKELAASVRELFVAGKSSLFASGSGLANQSGITGAMLDDMAAALGTTREELEKLNTGDLDALSQALMIASKNVGTLSNAASEGSSQLEDYADGIDAITAATGEYDLMLKSLKAELSAEDALNKFVAELQEYNEALSVAGNSTTDFASMLEYLKAASDIGQEFQGLADSLWALGDASVTSGDMVDYASQRVVGLIDAELGLGGTLVAANIDTSAAQGNVLNLLALIRQALAEMAALGAAEGGRNAQGDIILWENGEDADRRLKVIRDGEAAQAALARMDEYEASARTAQTAATNAATKAVDKNTGSTGKNSQAQKEAARTILDYVKDIETVIKTMNDLHFGVLDASLEVASTYEEIALQSARWALNLHDVEDLTDDVLKALYGRQNAKDSIADTFENIKKSIEDAKEEYEELIADLADQRASEAQLRYWLGIAQAVGDVAEEQRLLSQLQKNASEQTKTKSDVSQSSVQINFSTTGDSDAARKARSDMQELLSSYLKYIVTMAETGASEKEMAAATAKMRSSFVEQARQLGLNQTEIDALSSAFDANVLVIKKNATEQAKMNSLMQNAVKAEQSYIVELIKRGASQKEVNAAISAGNQRLADAARQLSLNKDQANFYAQALQGVKTIIDSLPKNINVNINVNAGAATAALNEFYAKEKDRAISQGGAIGGAMGGAIGAGIRGAVKTEADRALKLANKIAEINTSAMMTTAEKSSRINMAYARYEAGYSSFRKGGYTGDFGVNDIAGLVHGQEFVVNATATDKYRPILESMNKGNVSTTHATSAFATGSFALDDRSLYKLGSIILNGINNQRVMVTERAVQTGLSNLGATKAVSLIR